jgi:S-disulfanyl-L-cysteine oxidoreductase SoxD
MITLSDAMKVISAAQKKATAIGGARSRFMLANHSPTRPYTLTVAAGLALLVGASRAAAATEGWFTLAQATQGHQFFNNQCAECHRPDLTGAAGPALKGPTFLAKWGNKPLSDLYQFEHKNMPATNPGSVPRDQLIAITAYILQKNGFPAGNMPMDKWEASRLLTKN